MRATAPLPPSLRRRAALLAAAALLGACASAPPWPPAAPLPREDRAALQRELETLIRHELRAGSLAGMAIALVEDQDTSWAAGYGWADRTLNRPMSPDTLMRAGSISKLFTDTAAMRLVQQGRLQLDAPVQATLPWFRIGNAWPEAGPITLRGLMSHHAGLPRDVPGGMWLKSAPAPSRDFRSMLRGLSATGLDLPPGLAFSYSNVGLDLVGAMVETAAGEPFEAHLQRTLLDPLGMARARFSAEVPTDPLMARGHFKGEARDEPALRDVPAGGLSASVNDLARFVAMQFAQGKDRLGRELLGAAEVAAMQAEQPLGQPLNQDLRMGLGWMRSTFGEDTVHGGGPVLHHAGATFHHRAQLMLLPQHRLGVVVMANDGAATAAVNRVAQRALALLLASRTGIQPTAAQPGFRPAAQPWSAAQRAALDTACAGDWLSVVGPVRLRTEGERRWLDLSVAKRSLSVKEGEDGRFGLGLTVAGLLTLSLGPLDRMGFECANLAQRDVLLATLDGERLVVGGRLPPAALPADAAAWVGRYRPALGPDEVPALAGEGIEVLEADGRLWVQFRLAPVFGGTIARLPVLPQAEPDRVRLGTQIPGTGPLAFLVNEAGAPRRIRYGGWDFVREDGPARP